LHASLSNRMSIERMSEKIEAVKGKSYLTGGSRIYL
jgi:hypothetical protein